MSDLHNTAVRLARLTDAAAITTIYNQGIEERNATFETEPRTAAQITAQLTDKGERYPTVVVERDGQVVAWASAGLYRGRPCYVCRASCTWHRGRACRPRTSLPPLHRPGVLEARVADLPGEYGKSGVA